MALLDHLLREQMRRRAYGRRDWSPFGSARRRHRGYGMWGRPSRGLYTPRRRVQVRGCGCCLPIPLGLTAAGALAVRHVVSRHR
jgi:hypothetical protein